MPDKYPDKGDEQLQSGSHSDFRELKSSGIDYKRPLEFKARVIPYEGYENTDSPILAFSGNNVNIIFNIPREHFRKLAAAVLDQMDDYSVQSEMSNSFDLSNASKNGSSGITTKECKLNDVKDFDIDNTTEIIDAYKEECTYVCESLPNIVQAESRTRVDLKTDGKGNSSYESSSFDCEIGKSVEKHYSSDTTNSRSTSTVSTADPDILNHNGVAKKNQDFMQEARLDEAKCSEDSTLEVCESFSKGSELECSETNDIAGDVKVREVDPEHEVNIKMASNENLETDNVQNESIDQSSDKDSINETNDNVDIIDANLSAHTLDASFGSCPDLGSAWPDIHPFRENEVIPLTEIKSCESAGIQTKYFKLEFLHELIVLKVTLEENSLSVDAARYKETDMNSVTKKSKNCSEESKPFTDECREADKTVSIEMEKSMDKSESKIYKKSDLSNYEDKTDTKDVEIVSQLEDKINNPSTDPEESVKKNKTMSETITNTESCVSMPKHSHKEYEDQSEEKSNLESPSTEKNESSTENVDLLAVENLERSGIVKVNDIGLEMEEISSVDISFNEAGSGETSEHEASTEDIEKIQSTEIIDRQKELMLENEYSEKFFSEKLDISKDESLILSKSEMDEKGARKRSIASKTQLEESSAEICSSEDLSNAVALPIDSVKVSPIRRSHSFLDPENIKSPNRVLSEPESAIVSSDAEKEKPVHVSVSTPRYKPQRNYSGERKLEAANEDNSETNSSSLKFIPVNHAIIQGNDKDSVSSPKVEINASDQSGHLNVNSESGNSEESQATNVACHMTENQTECNACGDLNDTNYLDDEENKSFQSLSDKNASDIFEDGSIQKIERDSKELIKLPTEDAEKQLGDENGLKNELAENLESGSVGKVLPEKEKAENISVASKLSKISLSEGAEQVSDENKKGFSSSNTLTVNLKSGSVNEIVFKKDEDTSKNTSFFEMEISKEIPTECKEELSHKGEDGNCIENTLAEDFKSESVGQTALEEEETETVENISAECLEDIVEEVENESLRNASEDEDGFSANSKGSGNELEKTLLADKCDVQDAIEKTNVLKEKVVIGDTDEAVNESCTSESESLTRSVSFVTLDDQTSLQTSCLKSLGNIDNTEDAGNVIPSKYFENEDKLSDLIIEENGIAESLDNMSEEYPQDSVSNKTTSDESVEYRPQKSKISLSEMAAVEDIQDLDENGIENLSEEKTIEAGAESTSEVDILESDDSKSIASESDDSRDSERSALQRKSKLNTTYDETDSAPTRVRTRKAPSGLSEDVIPENSTVTRGAKSSKVRGLTADRSLKPPGKVSPNARSLRSKSLDPSPQSTKVSTRDKKHGSAAEAEEAARRKRASTPEVIKKDVKIAVRSSPRKLTRATSTNLECSAASKVQSTRSGGADSQVKARPNLETSVSSRRTKRGQ